MAKKIKYIFEGPDTPGDGVYRDTTLPEYFPDGEICMSCCKLKMDCSNLPFKDMRPIIGHYLDGTRAVRCLNFDRKIEV